MVLGVVLVFLVVVAVLAGIVGMISAVRSWAPLLRWRRQGSQQGTQPPLWELVLTPTQMGGQLGVFRHLLVGPPESDAALEAQRLEAQRHFSRFVVCVAAFAGATLIALVLSLAFG